MRRSNLLILSGLLAPLVYVLFTFIASISNPGIGFISQTLSQLGGPLAKHPWLFNTGIILYGGLLILFALGLVRRFSNLFVISLFLYGNANVIIGVAHVDPPNVSTTIEGTIHIAAARAAFALSIIAMLGTRHALPRKHPFARFSTLTMLLVITFASLFIFGSHDGLWQRLFIGITVLWIEVLACFMWRVADVDRDS